MKVTYFGFLGLATTFGLAGQDNPDSGGPVAPSGEKTLLSRFLRDGPSRRVVPEGPYQAPTGAQRWNLYGSDTYRNVGAFVRLPLLTLLDHADQDKPEWQGAEGYGNRLMTTWTASVVRHSVRHSMMAAIGHDPRYLPCRCSGTFRRLGHAFTYTFFTLDGNGRKVFDISRIISLYSGELATAGMFPGEYDVWRAMRRGNTGVSLSWTANVFREFWPDVARKIRGK